MPPPDELERYLRGDSTLSREYRREAAPLPPHALDRRVMKSAAAVHGKSPYLAPLALAATVLLSVALVLAIAFGPTPKRLDEAPHVVRAAARGYATTGHLYSSDPSQVRTPASWLADIAALRRAGRDNEADAELRRFRLAYPEYVARTLSRRP